MRGAQVLFLITLTTLYWGVVLLFALAQFWAICDPGSPGCPTFTQSGLRALGIVLAGSAVFAAVAWIAQRIFGDD